MITLKEGDKAPAFTGVDQDGKKISLSGFKGKKVVLYQINDFDKKDISQSNFDFGKDFEPTTIKSKANDIVENRFQRVRQDSESTTFQIHNQYIISQVKSGMLLIDQRAAYERILYEKFSQYLQKHNGASQQLLFPTTK